MHSSNNVFSAILLLLLFSAFVYGAESKSLEISKQAILDYISTPDDHGNLVPDFTSVGYMGGGVKLPDIRTVVQLFPRPEGDDRKRIQAALDKIGAMDPDEKGFRGALLLKAGTYRVHGLLHIAESGIVLRGEGQFAGGTSIIATKRNYVIKTPSGGRDRQHSLIYLGNKDSYWPPRLGFLEPVDTIHLKETGTVVTDHIVPVGSKEINVENVTGLEVHDNIVVEVFPNKKWVQSLELGNRDIWSGMAGRSKSAHWTRFRYERQIARIQGNQLTLDAPMLFYLHKDHLEQVLVWKYADDKRISQCGLEHLRLISYFTAGNYNELPNYIEKEIHARSAIYVERAKDCWIRNITALHCSFATVDIQPGARNITVQDCACLRPVSIISGGRRYPFVVTGSRVLVQRCYAREARHAFASSSNAPGPNVFLDCLAEKSYAEIGPHLKWATGFLYDNIAAPQGRIAIRNGGGSHGWVGVNHLLWNCQCGKLTCDRPATGDTSWSIGSIASKGTSRGKGTCGHWVSHGAHVKPRSLYLWQMRQRRGDRAVENTTIDVQRQGDSDKVHDYLKATFAELNEWEGANDNNLIPDPGFRIAGRHSPWELVEGHVPPYLETLERTMNPVFSDNSAVVVPADEGIALSTSYIYFVEYPCLLATEIEYVLRLDYRMKEGTRLRPQLSYLTTKEWKKLDDKWGPWAKGSGRWVRYTFNWSISPAVDEKTNMPYVGLLKLKLYSESEYAIANPSIEIVDDRGLSREN